jgi:putative PEP-CTERM system TPR-repeat lipoprotein
MLPMTPPIRRGVFVIALAVLPLACSSPEEQKQRHFEQGNKYVAEKRDDFAVIEYANAVRIDPKFGEARLKLAETYERMNNIQAAVPEYIRAADALPGNRDVQIKATELLLLGKRFDDAKARATAILEKNPKDVDALILRANAMAGLKDPQGAIAEIEEALKVQPNDSRAFMSLGDVRMQSGDLKEAEAALRQAIAVQPSSVSAHLAFGNFLWAAGRQGEAEQEIKRAISLEPRNVLANRMLAALFSATNRLDEAESPLKVVAEVSRTPEARFELARYYVTAGHKDQATKLLNQLSADPATSARAETMLASMEYDNGATKEAHSRLDKVLAKTPQDSTALVLKAQWLANEQKLDEALDRAKAAVAADGQSAVAYYTLGSVQSRRREVPEAIKAYTEVLRLNPRLVQAQVELSRLNLVAGNRDAARRYAEEARQTAPTSPQAQMALARTLLTQGELDRAGTEISELLRVLPNSSDVHVLNATLQMLRKNDTAARSSFTRALELNKENVQATAGLVALDLQGNQVGTAVTRVEAQLAKQPNHVDLLTLAANVYNRAGQQDRAEQALRRAVAADPRYVNGYALLAQLYIKQRRLDEARTEFEAIVKRDPRAAGPRTMVGMILESQGKRAEAKRWYEVTVAELPNAPVAANNLAYIYAEEGINLDTALQLASSAKKAIPDNPMIDDTLGWVYYKKDLYALAVGPLQESAKKLPDNPDVLYHLGMTYAKMGQKAQSRDALERALKLNPKMASAGTARQTLSTVTQ